MGVFGEWFRRLWYLLNRRRFDAALQREMDAHRDAMRDRRRFGNALRLREDARDVWGWRWLDDLAGDLRIGIRGLRRAPGYTVVAVASLSLALALTAATSAVVNAYLIRALPFPESGRMYHVMYAPPGPWEPAGLSSLDWASLDDVVEHALTYSWSALWFDGTGRDAGPQRALAMRASRGAVEGLGIRPAIGRGFTARELDDALPVGLVSQRLWREQLGGRPDALGRTLTADVDRLGRTTTSFRVIGILPEGFWVGNDSRDLIDVVLPLDRPVRTYRVRLREGVSVEAAEARLTAAVRRIAGDLPANWPGVTLESARERYIAALRPVLVAAAATAALALLIACANLAVLGLLRAHRRQKETRVRLALGAGRLRIVRMLVAEAGLLVVPATAAGLALAWFFLRLVGPVVAAQLGRPAPGGEAALQIDPAVGLGVAVLGGVIAALLPALALLALPEGTTGRALQEEQRASTEGRVARRWRSALVTAEIAGAVALAVGGALMAQSLFHILGTNFGLSTQGLVRVGADFPVESEEPAADLAARYERFVRVVADATGAPVPLFNWPQFYETPKQPVRVAPGEPTVEMGVVPVSAGYFEVLGIALRRGRLLGPGDRVGAEPVALVSESAARRLWSDGDGLGRRVEVADRFIGGDVETGWRTVVGIVADVRQTYDDQDLADIYTPFLQAPAPGAWFYVTANRPEPEWLPDVLAASRTVEPRIQLRVAVPLPQEAARQWAQPRFLGTMLAGLAAFSMFLAMLGVYGVTAFAVHRRRREVAVRLAIGATSRQVVRMFIGEHGALLAVGLGLGLAGGALVGRLLGGHLHEVEPLDPSTFLACGLLVACTVWLATWWPARRATRRTPFAALHET